MPTRDEIVYWGAGPAPLPTRVLEALAGATLNYNNTGLGLAEHSHRSPIANAILAETKENLKFVLDVPDDYEILFMQGGGSGQFSATVYNLVNAWIERRRRRAEQEISAADAGLSKEDLQKKVLERVRKEKEEELKLDYLVTGSWSLKASQEAARLVGPEYVNVATDARTVNDGKFGKIPSEDTWKLTPTKKNGGTGAAFVYYCDNETVDGVEFPSFPSSLESSGGAEEDEPTVVADMSSNIISRRVDVKKFALIFFGAQKNVGSTGLTVVILRKSLLPFISTPAPVLRSLGIPPGPIVLDYPTIAKNNSLYNTLSITDVWVAGQVMGGPYSAFTSEKVAGMEKIANEKAALIYGVLDKYPAIYQVVPDRSVRSRMNICFRVREGEGEKEWLEGAEKRGLLGLKGHRSVGGIRASNYNAVLMEGVKKLVSYLEEYAQAQQG